MKGLWRVLVWKDMQWKTYDSNMSHAAATNLVEDEKFKARKARIDVSEFRIVSEEDYQYKYKY